MVSRGPGKRRFLGHGWRRLLLCRAFLQRSGSAGGLKLQVEVISSVRKASDDFVVQGSLSAWRVEAAALQPFFGG